MSIVTCDADEYPYALSWAFFGFRGGTEDLQYEVEPDNPMISPDSPHCPEKEPGYVTTAIISGSSNTKIFHSAFLNSPVYSDGKASSRNSSS